MLRRVQLVLATLLAVFLLTLAVAASTGWAVSKRECKQQCQAAIAACEDEAGKFAPGFAKKFRRPCKKAVRKACRRRGLNVCTDSETLVCAQPPPPTTTTITATTTTTTTMATLCQAFPATGQTTAYGTGSDGDLEFGAPLSYTDNGDGTITDNNTGLMWEKKSDDGSIHDKDNTYTWCGASCDASDIMDGTISTTFLDTLNDVAGGGSSCFAGYCDWRIPNAKELQSIVNYEVGGPRVDPAFDTGCVATCTVPTCSCTASSEYWSSTTLADHPDIAWYVSFFDGHVEFHPKRVEFHLRAVRGGLAEGSGGTTTSSSTTTTSTTTLPAMCTEDGSDTACSAYVGNPTCANCCNLDSGCQGSCLGAAALGCTDTLQNSACATFINDAGCAPDCCP